MDTNNIVKPSYLKLSDLYNNIQEAIHEVPKFNDIIAPTHGWLGRLRYSADLLTRIGNLLLSRKYRLLEINYLAQSDIIDLEAERETIVNQICKQLNGHIDPNVYTLYFMNPMNINKPTKSQQAMISNLLMPSDQNLLSIGIGLTHITKGLNNDDTDLILVQVQIVHPLIPPYVPGFEVDCPND